MQKAVDNLENGQRRLAVRFENVVVGRPNGLATLCANKYLVYEMMVQIRRWRTVKITVSLPLVVGAHASQATGAAGFKFRAFAATQFVNADFCFQREQVPLVQLPCRAVLQSLNRYVLSKLCRQIGRAHV